MKSFLKEVTEYISQNPQDFNEVVKAASAGLDKFVEIHKNKREALASNAMGLLMATPPNKNYRKFIFMVDPAFYQFPKGPDAHSPAAKEWWELFLGEAAKFMDKCDNPTWEWLGQTRGRDCLVWMQKVVIPALEEKGFVIDTK